MKLCNQVNEKISHKITTDIHSIVWKDIESKVHFTDNSSIRLKMSDSMNVVYNICLGIHSRVNKEFKKYLLKNFAMLIILFIFILLK